MTLHLGQLVHSFFTDHLPVQKGLRLGSIRGYRDTMRLFLQFLAEQKHRSIATLSLQDLPKYICTARGTNGKFVRFGKRR